MCITCDGNTAHKVTEKRGLCGNQWRHLHLKQGANKPLSPEQNSRKFIAQKEKERVYAGDFATGVVIKAYTYTPAFITILLKTVLAF